MEELEVNQQDARIFLLSQRLATSAIGVMLGTFILIGIGFSNSNLVHNAAHDSRHANSFPCH